MFKLRRWTLLPALAVFALGACGGDDEEVVDDGLETTTTEVITETDTTMAPVVAPVVETDTGLVETTTDVDVDVDTDTVVEP